MHPFLCPNLPAPCSKLSNLLYCAFWNTRSVMKSFSEMIKLLYLLISLFSLPSYSNNWILALSVYSLQNSCFFSHTLHTMGPTDGLEVLRRTLLLPHHSPCLLLENSSFEFPPDCNPCFSSCRYPPTPPLPFLFPWIMFKVMLSIKTIITLTIHLGGFWCPHK